MAIIGPGRIGQEIGRVARAFRMRVAMGRDNDPARARPASIGSRREELPAMLGQPIVLVVCAPQTPDTHALLGPAEFAALKPGWSSSTSDADRSSMRMPSSPRCAKGASPSPRSTCFGRSHCHRNPHSGRCRTCSSASLGEHGRYREREIVERFTRNLGYFLAGDYERMEPVLDKQRLY